MSDENDQRPEGDLTDPTVVEPVCVLRPVGGLARVLRVLAEAGIEAPRQERLGDPEE